MTTSSDTERAATGARERILRATLALVADGGVAEVTNRRVARAAGVSLGSLTYHFETQADLLRESLLLYVEEETERRERLAEQLSGLELTLEQAAAAVERLIATALDVPEQLAHAAKVVALMSGLAVRRLAGGARTPAAPPRRSSRSSEDSPPADPTSTTPTTESGQISHAHR